MVLFLYLWENVKKYGGSSSSDRELMRGTNLVNSRGRGQRSPHSSSSRPQTTNSFVLTTSHAPPELNTHTHNINSSHPTQHVQNTPYHAPSTHYPTYQQNGVVGRRAHFYPEGGWGWIICACAFLAHVTTSGAQLSAGALHIVLLNRFNDSYYNVQHWLGPFSWSISCLCSPLVVNLCRGKNVVLISFIGGLLFPLSLILTSFTTQIHEFVFSFGVVGGISCSLIRESSNVVLGGYFRRRRQFVEQVVLAGTGVGVTLYSLLYLSLSRHIEWSHGFHIGASLSAISAILPLFYSSTQRNSSKNQHSPHICERSKAVPISTHLCKSMKIFCVPSLKPLLWSSALSSFGLFAPIFLMSEFGKSEGLSGGSLLLLQTHLGLGLSLGVILGAILTLKKIKSYNISPLLLTSLTGILTGVSMITISSVKGYYGYSLSAWIYGIALGSYLYTLKMLSMDLTRTKHWERIWSSIQLIQSPGILLGTFLTSYMGKEGFYLSASSVLLGSSLLIIQFFESKKSCCSCTSPSSSDSSSESRSPVPPPPPPPSNFNNFPNYNKEDSNFHPLRRCMSLQQGIPFYIYNHPYAQNGANYPNYQNYVNYDDNCAQCNPSLYYAQNLTRSHSLPPSEAKKGQEKAHFNSLRKEDKGRSKSDGGMMPKRASSFRNGKVSAKSNVIFASNPTLFPSSNELKENKSNKSSTERFPDFPIEPQFFPSLEIPHQQQEPAFTRHYFDSSQVPRGENTNFLNSNERNSGIIKNTQPQNKTHQAPKVSANSSISSQNYNNSSQASYNPNNIIYTTTRHETQTQTNANIKAQSSSSYSQEYKVNMSPNSYQKSSVSNNTAAYYAEPSTSSGLNKRREIGFLIDSNYYGRNYEDGKVSSLEFNVAAPQYHSLRRPREEPMANHSRHHYYNHL